MECVLVRDSAEGKVPARVERSAQVMAGVTAAGLAAARERALGHGKGEQSGPAKEREKERGMARE